MSESTAPVSSYRIALYPCACAPDAFRAGRRSGVSGLWSRHSGHRLYPFGLAGLSWALRMKYSMSDFPDAPGTSSSRVLDVWKDPAHFVPEIHGARTRPLGGRTSSEGAVGHEV